MTAEWIWRDGDFVRWDEATVHVSAHALHYGSSVFEGIRAYDTPDGPAVFRLQEHTDRLLQGARIMRIDHDHEADALNLAILETVRRNGHESCYIRPIIFRGSGALGLEGRGRTKTETIILTMEWGRYLGAEAIENGVDVQISSFRRMAPDTHMALVKAGGNYVNSQFVSMEAHDNGFEEGIALDVNGYVSEGAGENIFVILDGIVYTPGAWSSILMGITRDSALRLLQDQGVEIRFPARRPRNAVYGGRDFLHWHSRRSDAREVGRSHPHWLRRPRTGYRSGAIRILRHHIWRSARQVQLADACERLMALHLCRQRRRQRRRR